MNVTYLTLVFFFQTFQRDVIFTTLTREQVKKKIVTRGTHLMQPQMDTVKTRHTFFPNQLQQKCRLYIVDIEVNIECCRNSGTIYRTIRIIQGYTVCSTAFNTIKKILQFPKCIFKISWTSETPFTYNDSYQKNVDGCFKVLKVKEKSQNYRLSASVLRQ